MALPWKGTGPSPWSTNTVSSLGMSLAQGSLKSPRFKVVILPSDMGLSSHQREAHAVDHAAVDLALVGQMVDDTAGVVGGGSCG